MRRVHVLVMPMCLTTSRESTPFIYESMREVPIDNPAQAMTGVGRRGGESEQGQGRARSPDQSAEMRGLGWSWEVSRFTHAKTRAGALGGCERRLV